mgnify:CR=1 FL=1
MKLELDMLEAFQEVLFSDARTKAMYGGSSSGKTTVVQQYGLLKALEGPNDETLVLMETQTDVIVGMYRPMCDMLDAWGIPYVPHGSAPINIALPNGHIIWFSPLYLSKGNDSSEAFKKYNNVRRVIVNEATALTWEGYLQLKNRMGRTKAAEMVFNWNPTDEQHWLTKTFIEPYLEGRLPEGVAVHHSTHWDNPHLTPEKHQEYEDLIKIDLNYYRVYCLGLPGRLEGLIYIEGRNWTHRPMEEWPAEVQSAPPTSMGLDWGYSNDQAALVAHWDTPGERYVHQLLYALDLTISDIAAQLEYIFTRNRWSRKVKIWADPSRPDNIEELKRAGWDVEGAVNDIQYGIDIVKSKPVVVSDESRDLIREKRGWCWAMKNGQPTNKPVDKFNHALDGERYTIASSHQAPNSSRFRSVASR